jgi:hypothetical protein
MLPGLICATCNLFTGSNFDKSMGGSWSMAFLGILILFFVIALLSKWLFESIDRPFNLILGEAAGIISYIVLVNLFCSSKIALVISLGTGIILGWLGGSMLGSGGE